MSGHVEFIDRVHTIQVMMNELVINHNSAKETGTDAMLNNVQRIMGEVYQKAAEKSFEEQMIEAQDDKFTKRERRKKADSERHSWFVPFPKLGK